MTLQTEIGTHLYLTRGMARRFGVDLAAAMHEGLLSRRDFSHLINRCRQCEAGAATCHATLATALDRPAEPPAFCENRELLLGLAATLR